MGWNPEVHEGSGRDPARDAFRAVRDELRGLFRRRSGSRPPGDGGPGLRVG